MINVPNTTTTTNASDTEPFDHPVTLWVFLSIESIAIVIGNSTLCYLFATNKILQTNQNLFIMSLSASDLLVGLSIAPCEYYRVCLHDPSCYPFTLCSLTMVFSVIASVTNLLLISFDRYHLFLSGIFWLCYWLPKSIRCKITKIEKKMLTVTKETKPKCLKRGNGA